jgi:aryl-alcohol dehydrogenase-like predicted oxidoreductase
MVEFLKIEGATKDDLIITISSSGNSPNIVSVLNYCKENNLNSLAFSIPASEHSTITSWGKDRETEAIKKIVQKEMQKLEITLDQVKQYEQECASTRNKTKKLASLANELGTSVAKLSIAWTIKNPNVSTTILGASKKEQLIENLKALDIVPLITNEVTEKIELILNNKPVQAQF